VEENQAKRIALVVEGIVGLAQVILDALIKDEPAACKVIIKHDRVEALDYLLCRGDCAERDPHVMPCVTLVDLVLPRSDGLGLVWEMRAYEQTRRLPVVAFSSAGEHQKAKAAYDNPQKRKRLSMWVLQPPASYSNELLLSRSAVRVRSSTL
jgi:CheY-like chemotaxis protein